MRKIGDQALPNVVNDLNRMHSEIDFRNRDKALHLYHSGHAHPIYSIIGGFQPDRGFLLGAEEQFQYANEKNRYDNRGAKEY